MAEVILENIQKHYGERAVVHDLNLHIADKGFTVLVGPSGCGKSTTLRMVAGLEDISAGRLLIDGRDVTHAPPQARDIAMVFQSYALYPHMSVHRNMAFGLLKTTSLATREIDRRVAAAADMLGISHLLQRKPNALSGGERQRVAIGRALVRQPKVFLFDEPLSNLDAKLRNKMRWELKRLHRELGLTVLYVTHDQIEAVTLGDRIAIMQGGRLQQVDAPMTVYRRPVNTFVASFIGAPEMNLLPCRMDRGSVVLCHPAFTLPLQQVLDDVPAALAAQSLLLGLRPEEIRIVAGDAPATLRGPVRHVELVGADALVEVMAKDSPIMVRVPADAAPSAGDEVCLAFDLHRLRLFDAATGRAVWGGGA